MTVFAPRMMEALLFDLGGAMIDIDLDRVFWTT
jgi:hypothetical protein